MARSRRAALARLIGVGLNFRVYLCAFGPTPQSVVVPGHFVTTSGSPLAVQVGHDETL